MANQHKEKLRGIRNISEQLWKDFEAAASSVNSDRSAELRAFMEWYVRYPEAKPPRRPAGTSPPDTVDGVSAGQQT